MIGEKLKKLRETKGLSQKELALELDVKQSTISVVESCKSDPSGSIIKRAAKFFNVSTDFLLDFNLDSSKEVPNIALSKEEMKNYVKQLREIADKLEASFEE